MMTEAHTNHRTGTVMTRGPNQDHQIHTGKETYDTTDRRNRHDSYTSRSENSYNTQLTSSQRLEVKLFLDKILYFDR